MNIRAQVQRLLVEGVPIKRQEVGGGAIYVFISMFDTTF